MFFERLFQLWIKKCVNDHVKTTVEVAYPSSVEVDAAPEPKIVPMVDLKVDKLCHKCAIERGPTYEKYGQHYTNSDGCLSF